jgi:hypothetical protein
LLGLARSTVYCLPAPANDDDLGVMRLMGIVALGPRPRTSKPVPGHKIYPYLLRDLVIDRPNQGLPRTPIRGLGGGHHLHPDAVRLSLSGRHPRLGEPGGAGVAPIEQHGRLVLLGGPR